MTKRKKYVIIYIVKGITLNRKVVFFMFTVTTVNKNGNVHIHQGLSAHEAFNLVKKLTKKDEFGFYLFLTKVLVFFPNGKLWEKYI